MKPVSSPGGSCGLFSALTARLLLCANRRKIDYARRNKQCAHHQIPANVFISLLTSL